MEATSPKGQSQDQIKTQLKELLPESCQSCYHALGACAKVAGELASKEVEVRFVSDVFAHNFDSCPGLKVELLQLGCDQVEKKTCTNPSFADMTPSQTAETAWENIGLVYKPN